MPVVSGRRRVIWGVAGVIALALVGVTAWVAHLANPHTTLSESEGRTFFGVMLTYIPLVLIAAYVQRRPEALENAESVRIARTEQAELASRVDGFESTTSDLRERLASPDAYAAAMWDLATRAKLVADIYNVDRENAELRSALAERATMLESVLPEVKRDSRVGLSGVVVGVFGIVFSLMGVLWPGSALVVFVMVASLGLTFDLLEAATSPWLDIFSERENLAWRSAIFIPYALVLGALIGLGLGIKVG